MYSSALNMHTSLLPTMLKSCHFLSNEFLRLFRDIALASEELRWTLYLTKLWFVEAQIQFACLLGISYFRLEPDQKITELDKSNKKKNIFAKTIFEERKKERKIDQRN